MIEVDFTMKKFPKGMLTVVVDHVDGALSIKTLEESGMMEVVYEG